MCCERKSRAGIRWQCDRAKVRHASFAADGKSCGAVMNTMGHKDVRTSILWWARQDLNLGPMDYE
jgi:hypothetical protein